MVSFNDTVKLMNSSNYDERFLGEFLQLKIRITGLTIMLRNYKAGNLKFKPKCSYDLLNGQLKSMYLYEAYLEERAVIEGIDLSKSEVL